MFVQDILRKKNRLEPLIDRFMLMRDYFELYVFTNEVHEVEHGMMAAAADLFRREGGYSSGGDRKDAYLLQQAKLYLAWSRSDRVALPYDSLGQGIRQALEEGEIPPVRTDREAYPRAAPEAARIAYRLRVGDEILAYIDREIDLTDYSHSDAARCLIDAALRCAPMSFADGHVATIPGMMAASEEHMRELLDRELGADRYDRATRRQVYENFKAGIVETPAHKDPE